MMMPSFYQNGGIRHKIDGWGDFFPQEGILYILFCLIFLCDPTELKSFGFSIEAIFSKFLGDPRISYISYHIRRSHATILVHSALPLGYSFYLDPVVRQVSFKLMYLCSYYSHRQVYLQYSIVPFILASTYVAMNYYHISASPIEKQLLKMKEPGETATELITLINADMQSNDNFQNYSDFGYLKIFIK